MRVLVKEIEIDAGIDEWNALLRSSGAVSIFQKKFVHDQLSGLNLLSAIKPFFIPGYERAYEKGMWNSTQVVNPRGRVLDQRG